MVTSSRLLVEQWIFSPGGISSYLIPDFTPSAARFIPNDTISKGVCRVLVLRCRSTSQLTCLVSFHQSYTVILSYSPTSCTFIQSYVRTSYIHTFIHSYNHTFIHEYFHIFIHIIYTTFIHGCSVTQSLVWSYPFSSVLTHHCVKQQVLQTNSLQLPHFHKKCHP